MAIPLFSLHSQQSVGIGEIPDLKLLVDWCTKVGFSLIQLLPLNDVGFNFTPYDAASSFAVEPMYLSPERLQGVDLRPFRQKISGLRKQFPLGGFRVNYKIKKEKMKLFFEIFRTNFLCHPEDGPRMDRTKDDIGDFSSFVKQNSFWILDYALFKVLKEIHKESSWESWPSEFKNRDPKALRILQDQYEQSLRFHQWLQWQLALQLEDARRYAAAQHQYFLGDMPFLVSRDSADVWANTNYFKLNLAAGAPPDAYMAKGQRWGMPPYEWQALERDGFRYIKEKLRFYENFYDLIRIDHAVGVFRLWTIPVEESLENGGLKGHFDPPGEELWEAHGRKLFSILVENTSMLASAEDLGVIPECSSRVLREFGIPGMEIQRWMKDWGKTYDFLSSEGYRAAAVSMLGTHDSTSLKGWWRFEAGTVDGEMMKRKFQEHGLNCEKLFPALFDLENSAHGRLLWRKEIANEDIFCEKIGRSMQSVNDLLDLYHASYGEKEKYLNFIGMESSPDDVTPEFAKKALLRACESQSIFSVHLLQDWFSMDENFSPDAWDYRINFPGILSPNNWTLAFPVALEEMMDLAVNLKIREINQTTGRL
ncbi:MAG: 4-alpha-glucanotransferase [Candidatus Omnitrophica bacterium]|nr:4-alpha-glucanotransferase [Candidatus Omnitrophota bacterium]